MDDNMASVDASIPMNRFGTPEEAASIINFLASDEAGYVTGSIYGVHGGTGALWHVIQMGKNGQTC